MPVPDLYINGYPLSNLGLAVSGVTGLEDSPGFRDRLIEIPQRAGSIPVQMRPSMPPRTLRFSGVLVQGTVAARQSAFHSLKSLLASGVLRVSFAHELDKFILAKLQDLTVQPVGPLAGNPYVKVEITLLASNPWRFSEQTSLVGVAAGQTGEIPLGTGPVAPTIIILGAATNPVVSFYDAGGVVQRTMGFTITLASTDYLEVDCDRMVIRKSLSGTRTQDNTLLTSGDFIVLDPQYGDYLNSAWPRLGVSAGSLQVEYRKAWL